jgi:hypothetical protein
VLASLGEEDGRLASEILSRLVRRTPDSLSGIGNDKD